MEISILGSGCPTCKKLYLTVNKVIEDEGLEETEVEYSTDIQRILKLGLMTSPVILVDNNPVTLRSTSERDVRDALLSKITDNECPNCSCEDF